MLTMSYDDLAGRVGAATVVGSTQGGSLIAPETVRRLACDANIIPTVLGSRSEVLNQGRATRLATPGQLAALWLRDAVCTFPGCTTPAHWCDAHHLIHWADGGTSTLTNLALLCGRHHSIAHRDHLIGHVNAADTNTSAVTWNLIPGSYHRRDDRPPPATHHPSDDPPPGKPPADPRPPDEPPADTSGTPHSRPTPDQYAWDTPAPDADPWTDPRSTSRHEGDRPAPERPNRPDGNPEADPWFDSGPAA